MVLLDVLFPVNLKPLTYLCPDELLDSAVVGAAVSAPLRSKTRWGIVIGRYGGEGCDMPVVPIKAIAGVLDGLPVLSEEQVKLVIDVGQYYSSPPGLALRTMLPVTFFKNIKARSRRVQQPPASKIIPISESGRRSLGMDAAPDGELPNLLDDVEIHKKHLSPVLQALEEATFSVTLLHAPDYRYALSYLMAALKAVKSALVLCPEIKEAEALAEAIGGKTGKLTRHLHSRMPKGQKSRVYRQIVSKEVQIITGASSAVMAPIKKPSLIAVIDEHSLYYKREMTPRYNARDVALKRGLIEDTPVLLISATPSAASYYCAMTGKYNLIKPKAILKRPVFRVVKTRTPVSHIVSDELRRGGRAFIFINRKGYSTVSCSECGFVERCTECSATMVMHEDKKLYCHRCGATRAGRNFCPKCSGNSLVATGAGTERMEEILKASFGVAVVRIDSDSAPDNQTLQKLFAAAHDCPCVIGTRLALKPMLLYKRFRMAVMANPDFYMAMPDYMAMERLFQEAVKLSELARESVYLQCSDTRNEVYGFLKHYDYEEFIKRELQMRQELNYPPYSIMAHMKVHLKTPPGRTMELPPYSESPPEKKGFALTIHFFLRAKDRESLDLEIGKISRSFKKGVSVKTAVLELDFDPVSSF